MRARDRDVPGADYGLEHGIVGIGDTDERRIDRFASVPDGTFVWTRDTGGRFHLGRIAGPCRSVADSPVGLSHVRPVEWLDRPFGPDEVPGAVAATFARGGLNFQRTHDAAAESLTAALWTRLGSG